MTARLAAACATSPPKSASVAVLPMARVNAGHRSSANSSFAHVASYR
ncbi:MAG: hypothetical protein Q7T56_06725 [Nocardioidaceae bacterium]|nr:hypothetical protein [Nocardioidaceae bacterium]